MPPSSRAMRRDYPEVMGSRVFCTGLLPSLRGHGGAILYLRDGTPDKETSCHSLPVDTCPSFNNLARFNSSSDVPCDQPSVQEGGTGSAYVPLQGRVRPFWWSGKGRRPRSHLRRASYCGHNFRCEVRCVGHWPVSSKGPTTWQRRRRDCGRFCRWQPRANRERNIEMKKEVNPLPRGEANPLRTGVS